MIFSNFRIDLIENVKTLEPIFLLSEIFPFDDELFVVQKKRVKKSITYQIKKEKYVLKPSRTNENKARKLIEEYICKIAMSMDTNNIVNRQFKCQSARDLSLLDLNEGGSGK